MTCNANVVPGRSRFSLLCDASRIVVTETQKRERKRRARAAQEARAAAKEALAERKRSARIAAMREFTVDLRVSFFLWGSRVTVKTRDSAVEMRWPCRTLGLLVVVVQALIHGRLTNWNGALVCRCHDMERRKLSWMQCLCACNNNTVP